MWETDRPTVTLVQIRAVLATGLGPPPQAIFKIKRPDNNKRACWRHGWANTRGVYKRCRWRSHTDCVARGCLVLADKGCQVPIVLESAMPGPGQTRQGLCALLAVHGRVTTASPTYCFRNAPFSVNQECPQNVYNHSHNVIRSRRLSGLTIREVVKY